MSVHIERFYGHPQRQHAAIIRARGHRYGGTAGGYFARRRWDAGCSSTLHKSLKLERLHHGV